MTQDMAIPTSKKELKEAIKTNYEKLQSDFENIPDKLTSIKDLDGHSKNTSMSVCDLVSYLIGWGELVLKWNKKKDDGEKVDFPETGYKWNELGKLAQKFYGDYKGLGYSELLIKLDRTVNSILKLVDKKTNRQLYELDWHDKWTLGRLIQFNTSSPYLNARTRIRKWKKSKDIK